MMSDFLVIMGEMADTIKNPTHQTKILYTKVMKVEGFYNQVLVDVFYYLQLCEGAPRGFMAKKMALHVDQIRKYLSQIE